ncbi:MAG: PqqD family protein [Acidobacteriota bacterium]|nr:MAG: PqqD family protein [Acidobacteriota bacterium]
MGVTPDFLQSRFERRLDWEEQEDGRIVVFRPRFGESHLGRKMASLLGISDYRIRLDEVGSLVWKCCDSGVSAAEIASRLRERFGQQIEPAEDKLLTFVQQMNRARMVNIIKPAVSERPTSKE